MREDTKVIIALTLATLIISISSIFILLKYGPVGRVVEITNATFTIAETTTSTTSTSTTSTAAATTVSPGGGGRTEEVIIDFDILVSEPLRAYAGDTLATKVLLRNGNTVLNGISLSAVSDIGMTFTFSPSVVTKLNANEEKLVDLIVGTPNLPGSFLITIQADVKDPKVSKKAFLFVDLLQRAEFNKTVIVSRISFTYDLFKENPECLELNEVLEKADKALAEGRGEEANNLVESAVRACRDLITSREQVVEEKPVSSNLGKIIAIIIGIILLILVLYELIKPRFGSIRLKIFIVILVGMVYLIGEFSFTGLVSRSVSPSLLDYVNLKVIIGIDIVLLITYLRLRFMR